MHGEPWYETKGFDLRDIHCYPLIDFLSAGAAFVRIMVQLLKDCMFLQCTKSLYRIYWLSNSSIPSCSSAAWYIPYRAGEMFPTAAKPYALICYLFILELVLLSWQRCVCVPCGSSLTQFHPSCNPKITETVVPLVVTAQKPVMQKQPSVQPQTWHVCDDAVSVLPAISKLSLGTFR